MPRFELMDELMQDRRAAVVAALQECVGLGVRGEHIEALANECAIPLNEVWGWRTPRAVPVPFDDAGLPF